MVLEFTGQVEITPLGNYCIEDLSAGSGADGRFFDGSFGRPNDADRFAAGDRVC